MASPTNAKFFHPIDLPTVLAAPKTSVVFTFPANERIVISADFLVNKFLGLLGKLFFLF